MEREKRTWGGGQKSEKMHAKHTKIRYFCHFYAEIVKFGPILNTYHYLGKGGGKIRDAKGRKVSGNFGNFPWKVSGILKGWEFSEILGIFNLDLFSTFYEIICKRLTSIHSILINLTV